MKHIYCAVLITLISQLANCQQARESNYKLHVEVTDEQGNPVNGASVHTIKLVLPVGGISGNFERNPVILTNAAGVAIIEYKSINHASGGPSPNASVSKNGWYASSTEVSTWPSDSKIKNNTYEAKCSVILKPIKNPIPMIARNNLRIRTPEFEMKYSFDLEKGQALPPYGEGVNADIEFTLSGKRVDSPDPEKEMIDFHMEITCPNKEDGFVEFLAEDTKEFSTGSKLISAHEAPLDGYVKKIIRKATTDSEGKIGGINNQNETEGKKCYYFRVRTRKDAQGKIISSHFGKMYGPLEIRPAFKRYGHDISKGQGGFYIQYLYFNPTPNDSNLEFDPERNLYLKGNVPHP